MAERQKKKEGESMSAWIHGETTGNVRTVWIERQENPTL